ncbi:hypothetical protein, partial [Mycobacterium tuberculosis]
MRIEDCECLRDLTLLMFAPNIKYLVVVRVTQLEDIINKEKACEGEQSEVVPFQKLISLQLIYLPE